MPPRGRLPVRLVLPSSQPITSMSSGSWPTPEISQQSSAIPTGRSGQQRHRGADPAWLAFRRAHTGRSGPDRSRSVPTQVAGALWKYPRPHSRQRAAWRRGPLPSEPFARCSLPRHASSVPPWCRRVPSSEPLLADDDPDFQVRTIAQTRREFAHTESNSSRRSSGSARCRRQRGVT